MGTRVTIDDALRSAVEPIFQAMGMDLATGINIYLRKVEQTRSIPFTLEVASVSTEVAVANAAAHKEVESRLRTPRSSKRQALLDRMNQRKVGADMNQREVLEA